MTRSINIQSECVRERESAIARGREREIANALTTRQNLVILTGYDFPEDDGKNEGRHPAQAESTMCVTQVWR